MLGVGLTEVDEWPEVVVGQACRREVESPAGCRGALDVFVDGEA